MSLDIKKNVGEVTTLALSGRLDSATAGEFQAVLNEVIPAADSLVLDLKNLEYISSDGLRSILKAHKSMKRKKGMELINVSESVMEVFELTGFTDFLNIKDENELPDLFRLAHR